MQITKHDQLRYRGRKKAKVAKSGTEAELQEQVNEILAVMQVDNLRVPDTMDGRHIRSALCGMADNVCMIPVGQGLSLCLNLELKTATGKLHGKQKRLAKKLGYQVARSAEEAVEIVKEFQQVSRRVRKYLEEGE